MTVIGKSSHALFFNGVSDSVVCPLADFTSSSLEVPVTVTETARSSYPLLGDRDELSNDYNIIGQKFKSFSIEAWVLPDCGGVVASKEGLFELKIGTPGAPGPISFTLHTDSNAGVPRTYVANSAEQDPGASTYKGIIYPTPNDNFILNNSDINKHTRELLHIAGVFDKGRISVMVNGDVVGSVKADPDCYCKNNSSDLLIGGQGGEFRGYIEGVSWKVDSSVASLQPQPLINDVNTIGLWRFEEPVEVEETIFHIKSNASPGDTILTLDAVQAQTLYEIISGKAGTMPSTYSVPSMGTYRVAVTPSSTVYKAPHTIANLLINPTCTDIKTGKPNSKPPERIRLKSISSDGTITVESIHLDFHVSPTTGSRGILHGRTAFDIGNNLANDSTIVLLKSDLLLDAGTGSPLQPPGLGSQGIDTNGMTVIDESGYGNHGFIFSRTLSVGDSSNAFTVSSANWTIDDKFRSGHNGRHVYTHTNGHGYLKVFPPATEETVVQTIDGLSDIIEVNFDGNAAKISEQVAPNSEISIYRQNSTTRGVKVKTSSLVKVATRNGMGSIDSKQEEIIAIGGPGFDIRPFLLKGHGTDNVTQSDDIYELHLSPETESRVAMLETGIDDFPYMEIHYNAIDLTGSTIGISGPALLVEKTVPSGGSIFGNGVTTTVAARLSTQLTTLLESGSGMTLHSPGGILFLDSAKMDSVSQIMAPHYLVGDNTGGQQNEFELDKSRLPSVYSPQSSTDLPRSPPIAVPSNHADSVTHPSVYHRVIMKANSAQKSSDQETTGDFYRMSPSSGNLGSSNQSTHTHEMYDIIDNVMIGDEYALIIQPSLRSRTMQLTKFAGATSNPADPSFFSIEYLQSRGRVTSFKTHQGQVGNYVRMTARGVMDDIAGMQSEFFGKGSSDSLIVKETKPDAPVVTVTLGGPGQGAVDTVPTWDKSPLTRLGWSNARDGGVTVDTITGATIKVTPLNNESTALASWGTYMFPPRGRISLPNGASAEYWKVDGEKFYFHDGTSNMGSVIFSNGDGSESVGFDAWVTANSVSVGDTILLDPLFDEASVVSDGTTINDRLFQSIGSVAHDYQLGTQYASTRALVEIPVFSNQFFDQPASGVFPGPNNSMKIHLDPTFTAHSWAPNPVGRRPIDYGPLDRDVMGPYYDNWVPFRVGSTASVTDFDTTANGQKLYVEDVDGQFLVSGTNFFKTYNDLRNITDGLTIFRRVYRTNGEWAQISTINTTTNEMLVDHHSKDFWSEMGVGVLLSVGPDMETFGKPIRDDSRVPTAINEFRRPFYYDRANVQTQGGNIDYGLRQYVSAVEFKEGPTANPHAPKIISGGATFKLISEPSSGEWEYEGEYIPNSLTGQGDIRLTGIPKFEAVNQDGEVILFDHSETTDGRITVTGAATAGDVFTISGIKFTSGNDSGFYLRDYDGAHFQFLNMLNSTWNNAFAPGGLRHGDTVWMNMHYTNPHAIEGLFCKSRGVLSEFSVWNGFTGGRAELGTQARDSVPLENFLIGNTCIETARNFVQHVNKTVELNWVELGYSASEAPVIAYLDPYLAKDGHARILLYDVAHDREFIAFHDIHMQVQTGQTTPRVYGLDVANGFASQAVGKNLGTTTDDKSTFIETAYSHNSTPFMDVTTSGQTHDESVLSTVMSVGSFLGSTGRNEYSSVRTSDVLGTTVLRHSFFGVGGSSSTTFCDTPDGTRAIPAFLCLKGNRANSLDLTQHSESRLQHLPQWTQMDFVRRLTLDLGEVAQADGVSDVESAVREMVRRVNQAAALQGSTGGGSAHDPAPFWDDTAFDGDKGSHMGYLRAHFGRAVKDLDGNDGYTIVIHSTVPGASGRNFCVWLDNSSGQAAYRPQFLVGHGGRFRTFWCMPIEGEDENMHPAPMPITKNGRPFAPITTLRQMVPPDEEDEEFINNLGTYEDTYGKINTEMATGRAANTVYGESFESQGDANRIVEGLRPGGRANARINFGGLVASGIPGWAPDAGPMGFGAANQSGRFDTIYGSGPSSYSAYVSNKEKNITNVGQDELYGFRFTDHRGTDHTIRLIYREAGENFANNNTILPSNIENEIVISFDDRDVSKGGFTIGRNMAGSAWPTSITPTNSNTLTELGPISWRGNTWGGIKAPCNGYPVNTATYNGTDKSLIITLKQGTSGAPGGISDHFGFLGFPMDGGLLVYNDGRMVSATGSVTITNYPQLNVGDKVTLTDTKDSNHDFTVGAQAPASATWDPGSSNNTAATNLAATINANSRFTASATGSIVTITQVSPGLDGNTTITLTDSGDTGMTKVDFTGGDGPVNTVLRYTYREAGAFYGITGGTPNDITSTAPHKPGTVSPMLNWTTIVTDELIAAAVEYAMTVDPNTASAFNCSEMYAPDGRTYKEWMGANAGTAIQVHTLNESVKVTPLKDLFSVSRGRDWGLYSGNVEIGTTKGGLSLPAAIPDGTSDIEKGIMLDVGYLPKTVLNITSNSRGSNANTATPVLIKSDGSTVSTAEWKKHLRGEKFTAYAGDHITPCVNNPIIKVDDAQTNYFITEEDGWLFLQYDPPAGYLDPVEYATGRIVMDTSEIASVDDYLRVTDGYSTTHTFTAKVTENLALGHWKISSSFAEMRQSLADVINHTSTLTATLDSSHPQNAIDITQLLPGPSGNSPMSFFDASGDNWWLNFVQMAGGSYYRFFHDLITVYDKNGEWAQVKVIDGADASSSKLFYVNKTTAFSLSDDEFVSLWKGERARLFAGNRVAGNTLGEPLTYFRGAHDSPDHSVPLYFGGGFSGVVMDINDGTQNDYTEFYSHPYASGPTGCAGLQNVGENMGAHAILDTTAMLAMFPGTPFLSQHRGESQSPFANADALLAPDMNLQWATGAQGYSDGNQIGNSAQELGFTGNNGAINTSKAAIYRDSASDVDNQTAITHPTPIVLRFAHPYARYTDAASGCADEVAYVVFGPGQSVPKHFYGYNNSGTRFEPSADRTVEEKNTHVYGDSTLRLSGTEAGKYHPNEMSKGWLDITPNPDEYTNRDGNYQPYLPPPMSWQKSAPYPYALLRNWEPSYGTPSGWLNSDFTSSSALLISNHWRTASSANDTASLKIAHPFSWLDSAGSNAYPYRWHMDGGYPAGGNWFDYAVRKNPLHPTTNRVIPDSQSALSGTVTLGLNASMFRVGSLALTEYDTSYPTVDGTPRDVFIVDATRVQNSEELGAIISAAINSFPGEGNLKALGGTFLPSFQDAIRQDRYSWIDVGALKTDGYTHTADTVTMGTKLPKFMPAQGWIRLVDGSDNVYYGRYESYTPEIGVGPDSNKGMFTLGKNLRFNLERLEKPDDTGTSPPEVTLSTGYTVYVWSKTGNLRWDNGAIEAMHASAVPSSSNPDTHIYHHLAATQVHFNGFVDAIDRTRPVGAVGWHGERYSYLNSLKVAKTDGTDGIGAGLGAWHPMLGFNPYGDAMNAHALNGASYSVAADGTFTQDTTGMNTGLHPRHYVVVSNEAELPIIAKADRDGLILCGDMLDKKWGGTEADRIGGTVIASHSDRHNNDRFAAYAHGGPHVDAQFITGFAPPTPAQHSSGTTSQQEGEWSTVWSNSTLPSTAKLYPMETCLFPTGDLFFDRIENPGVSRYPQENPINHSSITSSTFNTQSSILADPYAFWGSKSAARNFFVNHVVWKRMDGGNLCMPAPNARGLGAVPWVWRKVGSSYVKFGETIYGNTRFSFETTNSAVFPTVQAQELAHPQLTERYPVEIGGVLSIPNEEMQFEAITVVDDSGQEHKLEGGSPLGTVIRDFSRVADRDVQGPALAGSGNKPNLKINLPDPNTIPGNIVVRSGFDKVQSYQHETMGTGGLQRPNLPDEVVSANFNSTNTNPSTGPFWENEGWERVDTDESQFPSSKTGSMNDKAPLQTSYEPHDRALYFHLTKMGWGYTEREPLGIVDNEMTHKPLVFKSTAGDVLTFTGSIEAAPYPIWMGEKTPDGRSFLTVNGHVVSFTGVSGSTFTGCKFTPGFSATEGDTMKPSFYVPAGSTRHFAARRLRDHAEVSGESPDKEPIDWMGVSATASPATAIRSDRLTPMPVPRMGHHYITPTMAVMPGHLSHPLYQRVYNLNRAYHGATESIEQFYSYDVVDVSRTQGANKDNEDLRGNEGVGVNPLMWFSSTSSPHPPSDIHGGAFTLMVETKVRYDGYGILAFDDENKSGGHRLRLERGDNYSTDWNFPDPLETGAYQIIIQPNLYSQQLMGFSDNNDFGTTSGSYPLLTDQQVATVVALQWNGTTYDFVLAEALKADVRGCEVYLNEVMLDIDPSPNQQFASLPSLALYNPLGVNESTSPAWSRKSLPYHPGMFRLASPGYTLTVPWWAPALKSGSGTLTNGALAKTNNWRKTEHYHPEDYYHYCRTGYGSVGAQSVMGGYPTHFLHPYLHSYMAFTPTCTVRKTSLTAQGQSQGSEDWIVVDNNALFPEVGITSASTGAYLEHRLSVVHDDGSTQTATYGWRGNPSGDESRTTNVFYDIVTKTDNFWAAVKAGKEIKLSGDYGTLSAGEIYTNKLASVAAHHIQDIKGGSGDTHTGHLPDAYLSMWHYNLGRPMTYYSDSRGSMAAVAVDKAPYNHLPEHYETVHYHDFGYVISDGPLDFRGFAWKEPSGDILAPSGMSATGYSVQARNTTHYGAFWPGGSRFGAQASRMDLWGTAGPGWGQYWDYDRIFQETSTDEEFDLTSAATITESGGDVSGAKRNVAGGYRFCVRPPFNRPRAALWSTTGFLDPYNDKRHLAYRPGAYVQSDAVTSDLYTATANGSVTIGTEAIASGHSGIIERVTNASALVGSDLKLQQVRYSHGRRMCRPFGCAVRNFVNDGLIIRNHQGDYVAGVGSGDTSITGNRRNLAVALAHYMTDWWGNTTGEDVRRFPMRGFGIRPAWDPEDAYRATDRTKSVQVFATPTDHGKARAALDFFDPATAKRVGDRGDGRGVRWPTVFNEDVLQDVDTIMDATGLVLSKHTSEPQAGTGYIRPKDTDVGSGEVKVGISRVLDVHDGDGLLKPEAMAGANIEKAKEALLPASQTLQEPIARFSPRIGLDSVTLSEMNNEGASNHVAIATEAHSLHTDRVAGRRYIVAGGIHTGDSNKVVGDFDLRYSGGSHWNFGTYNPVMRLNYTHGIWPMGGTLILDLENYMEPVSDQGWGASSGRGSNPYQSNSHDSLGSNPTNATDKTMRFLLRPVRVLDHRHLEVFRKQTNALSGTAGGKYGLFTYSTPNARATTSARFLRSSNPSETNPPYAPVYFFATSGVYTTSTSSGPNIPGTEASGFADSLKQTVARISISDNTLQHLRADAHRNGDFTIQPRYTQSLYPGTNLNKSDHSGESSHTDNEVDG